MIYKYTFQNCLTIKHFSRKLRWNLNAYLNYSFLNTFMVLKYSWTNFKSNFHISIWSIRKQNDIRYISSIEINRSYIYILHGINLWRTVLDKLNIRYFYTRYEVFFPIPQKFELYGNIGTLFTWKKELEWPLGGLFTSLTTFLSKLKFVDVLMRFTSLMQHPYFIIYPWLK